MAERGRSLNFRELREFDPSLKLVDPPGGVDDDLDFEFSGFTDFSALEDYKILFVRNKKYLHRALQLKAPKTALLLPADLLKKLSGEEVSELKDRFAVLMKSPNMSLSVPLISRPFYLRAALDWNDEVDGRQLGSCKIDPSTYIAQNVFIGKGVEIGKGSRIHSGAVILSGVKIGQNCEIYPQVTLYHNVEIGNSVRIHAGAVIGADGFGYNFDQGKHLKVWHTGGVVIGSEVEIGANSCIDQGTFTPTMVREGVKIDNNVQVGHNCRLGRGSIFCAHVAIGGSTTIGDFSVVGGRACFADNLKIGKNCRISGAAGVDRDWPDDSAIGGTPAVPVREWLRHAHYLSKVSRQGLKAHDG